MQNGDILLRNGGLERYSVVGCQLLHDEGYQKQYKLWLSGHHADKLPNARNINGWSGPETEYRYIEPHYRVIEVIAHRPGPPKPSHFDSAGLWTIPQTKGASA